MRCIFIGVHYYQGPVRHLYAIFEIYKALAKIFRTVGIDVKYFTKQNQVLPLQDTISEEQFYKALPEADLVFMWNGSLGQEKDISKTCKDNGIPVYYMELGWLPQAGTFYFDRKGVNYESSLTDWKPVELTQWQKQEANIKIAYYHQAHAKVTGIKETDFVFAPFQVESDSQIINHSRIKTMQAFVDYVCAMVPGKIIFKTHPKDDPGEIKHPPRCKLYKTGTTHDFLPDCKYVVTINSTVGVEALTYYKPVITLGGAFYAGRGLTYMGQDDESFRQGVAWAEQGRAAVGIIEAFLFHLFQEQWYRAYLDDPKKVLGLVERITG